MRSNSDKQTADTLIIIPTYILDMKLNPAIEKLKRMCGEKGPNDPEEFDIMNLVAGIITCSVPGALKECCSDNSG